METDQYEVGKLLGETDTVQIHDCTFDGGKVGFLKLAAAVEYNGALEREALVLRTLREQSASLELEFGKTQGSKDTNKVLNYDYFFPDLVDTFIVDEKDGRRVLIGQFLAVPTGLPALVPLAFLTEREKVYVDVKTSVWIVGKLLKLLTFAHSIGVSVGDLSTDNVVIERNQHFVMVFDWSVANASYVDGVPVDIRRKEIEAVGKLAFQILGGNPGAGTLPYQENLYESGYERMLLDFLRGGYTDAHSAHTDFYKLIRAAWPKGFHPFTTFPL